MPEPSEAFTGHIITSGPASGTGELRDGHGDGFTLRAITGDEGDAKVLRVEGFLGFKHVYTGRLALTGDAARTGVLHDAGGWGWRIDITAELGEVGGARALILAGALGPTPIHARIPMVDDLVTGERIAAPMEPMVGRKTGRKM